MKDLTSAAFRDTFTELTEPVQVRRYTTILGTWIPAGMEGIMEDAKKSIEPDKVRESRGRLTKGLGEVPGLTKTDRSFVEFRPAPKPGKK